ncbi:MAG: hypothetical protein ABL977_01485 [Candidatus Eisenbacteria bacterium]
MNRSQNAGYACRRVATTIGRTFTAAAVLALALIARPALAAPPAGTTIGNQATATYQDAASNSYTVTSNPVTTVVQQVASVTLTANGTRVAAPGGQAVFPHVLTNTGNGTDDFTLSAVNRPGDDFDLTGLVLYVDADGNGVPDDFTPVTSTGPLAAGGSYRFVAVGSVPGTRLSGDVSDVRVNAVSTFDGGQTAFNDDQVTVSTNAVINVTKSLSAPNGASPSGPYTYTLTYTNSGNATASALRLTDLIPAGMSYVPGSARWSATGATALSDADSTDTHGAGLNTIRFDHNVATPGAVTAIVNQVPPGQSGSVTFAVNVNSGLPPQTIGNIARFAYNDGAGIVGPFFTNSAPFTVDQSASVSFTGATVASALQGSTVSFTNTLTNNGNGADVFDISTNASSFPAGSIVQLFQQDGVTPLTDSNGNLIPDVGPLAPGASYNVILKVTLPASATGGPFQVSKTATSATDPLATATATDILTTITANSVDVTNNSALPGAPGAGAGPEVAFVDRQAVNPGATARFTLYVNNTSSQSDDYDLAASTLSSFASLTVPAGWTVTFRDGSNAVITSTGAIAAGGNMLVYADVDVPAGFASGDVELYFRALSTVSGASDVIHDQVGVNVTRNVTLTPNNTAQVLPGGFVVYTHTLSNNGNVAEGDGTGSSVSLSAAENQPSWNSAIYWDTNNSGSFDAGDLPLANLAGAGGLAPGANMLVFVQVFSPAGAALGTVNTTTITATTANVGYTDPVPADAIAQDATTVINGQVTIVKRQALDAACDGTADGAFSTLNLTTGAVPNACIQYEIVVTNTGTTPVSSVVINDATPANTSSSNAASAFTSQGTISVPANGATGSITANLGVLAPGASATIRFSVRIDYP